MQLLEDLADKLQAALPVVDAKEEMQEKVSAEMALTDFDVDIAICNTVADLSHLSPLPLRLLLPRFRLGTASACGEQPRLLSTPPPPVPPWHCPAAPKVDGSGDPDFHVYSCLCGGAGCHSQATSVQHEHEAADSLTKEAGWEQIVTERRWQKAAAAREGSGKRLLLSPEELLALSSSKLRALEQVTLWEELAVAREAQGAATIAADKARRIPVVLEMLEAADDSEAHGQRSSCPKLDSQLAALRAQLRDLDEERREGEVRLKTCEKEAAAAVAMVRQEQLHR
eukprot:TRINITY_DN106447_c0_g1_i1.p1 TRINITY_DN106447_c0_g1~~TRINITY_DN106447_c0_g1_i1.p1  ORF type:complete len:290 (+),score=75.10 TRINITY_DN106447_c0_g1_i1:22-870(+)